MRRPEPTSAVGYGGNAPSAAAGYLDAQPTCGHSKARVRWVINVEKWNPTQDEFDWLLKKLPQEECARVVRFMQPDDRQKALISLLA